MHKKSGSVEALETTDVSKLPDLPARMRAEQEKLSSARHITAAVLTSHSPAQIKRHIPLKGIRCV